METVAPQSVGLSPVRLKRLTAALQGYIDRGQAAGLISVVMRRGKAAHVAILGQMDLNTHTPMREDAIFRIYSMTKPLTCLAVMMLYEEAAFHLQTPVAQFIPAFANLQVFFRQAEAGMECLTLERPVTIHDLLTHTAGLGYGLDASTPVNQMFQLSAILRPDEPLAQKVERVARLPLQHQPGKYYSYSIGIDVLGRIVEIVSKMPLDEFFKKRIFEPLGMVDTDFYVPPEKLPRLATLYTTGPDGRLVDAAMVPGDPLQFPFGLWMNKTIKPAFLSGGGGLVSTTADYLRFGMLMRNKGELDGVRLVSRKTIELMTAPHLRPEQFFIPGASAGLGFTVLTDPAAAQMLGTAGAYEAGGAANTNFWVDPAEDMLGLLMVQYIGAAPFLLPNDFKVLAEQAITD